MERKVLLFNLINIILIVSVMFLVRSLPKKAEELKTLRSEQIAQSEQSELIVAASEIGKSQNKIDEIKKRFIDEKGLLNFIADIDKLKDIGSLGKFPIISNESTKDKTKNVGLPVSIEFRGDISRINTAVQTLESLPYIIRPIQFDLEYVAGSNEYNLKYGGFLYIE